MIDQAERRAVLSAAATIYAQRQASDGTSCPIRDAVQDAISLRDAVDAALAESVKANNPLITWAGMDPRDPNIPPEILQAAQGGTFDPSRDIVWDAQGGPPGTPAPSPAEEQSS